MSPIRGEQKVDTVRVKVVLPQPLKEDIDAFLAFNAELQRVLTIDALVAAAVRDALAGDKQFQAWRKNPRQPVHAAPAREGVPE